MIPSSHDDTRGRPTVAMETDPSGPRYTLLLVAMTLCGCASPGVPRPPSLRLPATVTDLTAVRVGDRVDLQWTAPSRTMDGLDLTMPTTVELCRDPAPAPSPSVIEGSERLGPCTPLRTLAGHAGSSTAVDQLLPPWTSSASTGLLIAYRVRTLNSAGRSAPPSPAAHVPAGPPLPAIAGFQARQTRAGVALEWPRAADASTAPETVVEVLRTMQTPESKFPNTPDQAPSAAKPAKKPTSDPFSRTRSSEKAVNVHLRQGSSSETGEPDPLGTRRFDGMIDRSAIPGTVYLYSAQRVQVVAAGGKTMEMRSEPTVPTTITMRDTFPPATPKGLVSVPGMAGSVDLAWEPNNETDLAGYFVYRTDLAQAASGIEQPARLNASPIAASTYRDESALARHRYAYRVAAVDRNGNLSALSLPVEDAPEAR